MVPPGFLRVSRIAAGLDATSAAGLVGCGSASSISSASSSKTGESGRGGNLKVGLMGGASSDTLDRDAAVTVPDIASQVVLFEPLVTQNAADLPALDLVRELSPDNPQATSWTIRLHQGVTIHNGKEFTADDLLYTFTRIMNPKRQLDRAPLLSAVDLKNVQILDTRVS
jgi:peptide/nickel transport system substrate-binding protein